MSTIINNKAEYTPIASQVSKIYEAKNIIKKHFHDKKYKKFFQQYYELQNIPDMMVYINDVEMDEYLVCSGSKKLRIFKEELTEINSYQKTLFGQKRIVSYSERYNPHFDINIQDNDITFRFHYIIYDVETLLESLDKMILGPEQAD